MTLQDSTVAGATLAPTGHFDRAGREGHDPAWHLAMPSDRAADVVG